MFNNQMRRLMSCPRQGIFREDDESRQQLLFLLLFLLLLLLLFLLLLQIESRSSARIQFAGCLIFQDFDALKRRQSYAMKELRSRSWRGRSRAVGGCSGALLVGSQWSCSWGCFCVACQPQKCSLTRSGRGCSSFCAAAAAAAVARQEQAMPTNWMC